MTIPPFDDGPLAARHRDDLDAYYNHSFGPPEEYLEEELAEHMRQEAAS
jgi:hypothetical protein